MSFSLSNDGFIYLPTSNQLGDTQSTSRPIMAIKVTFDPMGTSLISTDVQSALEELATAIGGIPVVSEMTPLVAGTAYGNQKLFGRQSNYGIGVKESNNSITFFNKFFASSDNQRTLSSNTILMQNICQEPSGGSDPKLTFCMASFNGTTMNQLVHSDSIIKANFSVVEDSIFSSNTALNRSNAPFLDSSMYYVNHCERLASSMTSCSVFGHGKTIAGTGEVTNSMFYGDLEGIDTSVSGCGVIMAQHGSPLTPANGSFYLGNGGSAGAVVQESNELRIGRYNKFKFDTLRQATTLALTFYDSQSKELTFQTTTTQNPPSNVQYFCWSPNLSRFILADTSSSTLSRVARGSATTDALGYFIVNVSSFGFAASTSYVFTATVRDAATGNLYSINVTKTSTTATILIEKIVSGSNIVLASPSTSFDYTISY